MLYACWRLIRKHPTGTAALAGLALTGFSLYFTFYAQQLLWRSANWRLAGPIDLLLMRLYSLPYVSGVTAVLGATGLGITAGATFLGAYRERVQGARRPAGRPRSQQMGE